MTLRKAIWTILAAALMFGGLAADGRAADAVPSPGSDHTFRPPAPACVNILGEITVSLSPQRHSSVEFFTR